MIILRNEKLDKMLDNELDGLLLNTAILGNERWTTYLASLDDPAELRKMRSPAYFCRARLLFNNGFLGAVLDCPPINGDTGAAVSFYLWKRYLEGRVGRVVLEGPPLPETPEDVLKRAGLYFMHGFILGRLAFEKLVTESES